MLIVSQLLSRIGTLLKVGTPEAGDAMIKIPNTYLGPLPSPVAQPSNQGVTYSDSFALIAQSTITNTGGGSTTTICTLVPGVWEFMFYIDSEFNWLNANPIAQDNRIILQNTAIANIEIWSMAARATRSLVTLPPFSLTLKDQNNLRLLQNGNGVGQTSTLSFNVVANRLL